MPAREAGVGPAVARLPGAAAGGARPITAAPAQR